MSGEKVIDLDAIRARAEEALSWPTASERDRADLLVLLDEAVGLLRALDGDPLMPIGTQEKVTAFLARFPTPSPTDEEKTGG